MTTVFVYKACSTCRTALKFLDARGVDYVTRPIVDQPPSPADLRRMLGHLRTAGLDLKNLFNTSGESYRAGGLADRFKRGLTDEDAIRMLAADGKLIKRPFLLCDGGGTVGFDADAWSRLLPSKTS